MSDKVHLAGYGRRSSQLIQEQVCIRRYGGATAWMGVMDMDEFFMPIQHYGGRGTGRPLNKLIKELEAGVESADSFRFPQIEMMRSLADESAGFTGDAESPLLAHTHKDFYRLWGTWPHHTRIAVMRAKEIFKPEKVWMHWVHYSKEGFPQEM